MSTAVLPIIPTAGLANGVGFPVKLSPRFKTRVYETISGKETRIADQVYPRNEYELPFDLLRTGPTFLEYQLWRDFFSSRQGSFDSFLITDPYDNAAVGQQIGIGTGAQTAYGLIRAINPGGYNEAILAPNVVTDVYVAGVPIPGVGLVAPTASALSDVAGGAIGGVTYFARTTIITAAGESPAATEASRAVSANRLLQVASPAAGGGALSWNVYVSTTTGTETRQNDHLPIAIGTPWTEPATGLVAGTALPSTGNTFALATWGSATPGIVTFTTAPAAAASITADFSYYWPVRFAEDNLTFENFMANRFALKSVKMITLKN